MVEGLLKFQDKITRKAMKTFEAHPDVSFDEFYNFVNFKMGTEFQEYYVRELYAHFLLVRKEKKEAAENPPPA
jgi:hypothetical protein